jgi:DNA-binding GntR family transcriptional regulator
MASEHQGSMASGRTFRRNVLSDDIYEHLRTEIVDGRLEPSTRIIEEALATELGVSRAPLREAIQRLRRDGLVAGVGRDTRVIQLSPKTIRELHLMRATLETLAFQSAARLVTDEDVTGLQSLIDDMRRVGTAGSRKMSELDYEFHRRMCKISGIERLYDAWNDQHVLFRLWLNVAGRAHEDGDYLADNHGALLAALRTGDPKSIAWEVTRHVYGVGSALAHERQQWVEDRALLLGEDVATIRANDGSR